MPPITREAATESWGEGLRSLDDEEAKQNELTSHSFDVPMAIIFDSQDRLTPKGKSICSMLSNQLLDLPFRASIQFEDRQFAPQVAAMMEYLFHVEMARPGQLGMSLNRDTKIKPNHIRIAIERFSQNTQN